MLTVSMFLIIAALAVGFLFKRLFAKEVVPVVEESLRRVPMLSSAVEAGTRIEASHVGSGPWKGDLTPDTLLDRNSVLGRIAKDDIPAANPLSASLFYPIGQRPPLDLAPGTRAVSVSLGNTTAMVDGLIGQGNFVDVWMTIDANLPYGTQRRRDSLSLKLFDGVKIIAINGSLKGSGRNRDSVVTMQLDAEQQSIMVAARQKGNITLTANPEGPGSGGLNLQMSESDRITLRQILGIEEPDAKKPFLTEQVRGNNRSYSQFDEDGNRVQGTNRGGAIADPYGSGVDLQRGGASADRFSSSTNSPARSGQAVSRDQVIGNRASSL
jgi:pilus assembly protein CpaB